jgi:RNA polymerase sigma factor (TIGR02999 family)
MSDTEGVNPGAVSEEACVRLLTDELYASLRKMARAQRNRLPGNDTLATTALVSEAYLKLSRHSAWKSRQHFLNTAAVAMRQVLVDYARMQLAAKRGGNEKHAQLDEVEVLLGESSEKVVHIDLALQKLQALDARLAKIVEYRFFAGYSDDEIAQLLGTSLRTVQRGWFKARAWLYQELDPPKE